MSSKAVASDTSAVKRNARSVGIGILTGILTLAGILLLFSILLTVKDIPQSMVDPMAVFAVSVGGFMSGFCCTKITRVGGLMYGAVCGAVMTALVLAVGILAGYGGLGIPALFKTVFIMLCSVMGGVLGVNTRKRGRR